MKKTHHNNISITTRLIIIYIVIFTIPALFLGAYFFHSLNKTVIDNKTETYNFNMQIAANNLINTFDNIVNGAYEKRSSPELSAFLNTQYNEDIEQYNAIKSVVLPLQSLIIDENADCVFKIYHFNPTITMSSTMITDLTPLDPDKIKSKNITWQRAVYNGKNYILNVIPIFEYSDTAKTNGYMLIFVPEDKLLKILQPDALQGHHMFLLNENGEMLLGDEKYKEHIMSENEQVKIFKNSYLRVSNRLHSDRLHVNNWRLIYLVPITDLHSQTVRILFTTISIIAACFFIALLIMLSFTERMKKRFSVILNAMKKLNIGGKSIRINDNSSDEIGQLNKGFDNMADKLDNLVETVYLTKIQLQESEIEKQRIQNSQIQAQLIEQQRKINPHYLFNTLESIRMKLLISGQADLAVLIKKFAGGYRQMMRYNNDDITVKQELQFVKNFLEVIKFRFPDRFDFSIQISNRRLLRAKIFSFMIQPLVENAAYHGIDKLEYDAYIKINIFEKNEALCISVQDNGKGMTSQQVEQLMLAVKENKDNNTQHLALKNIYKRLNLMYPNEFSFVVCSEEYVCTKVDIEIPLNF